MATPTYTLIDSTTLTSSATSVTFSSITQDYRDLVLVANFNGATANYPVPSIRLNNDSGSSYNFVMMVANGSSFVSWNEVNQNEIKFTYYNPLSTSKGVVTCNLLDYSATDKHKSILARTDFADRNVGATAGRWANTAAINQIEIFNPYITEEFDTGSSFYLYGILGTGA